MFNHSLYGEKGCFSIALSTTLLSLLLLTSIAMAGPVLKIGHVAPPFHGQQIGLEHFAKYLAEHSDGKWQCKFFPLGQLGGLRFHRQSRFLATSRP